MDVLPEHIVAISHDFVSGSKAHWKARFNFVVHRIVDLGPHKLIEYYFTTQCNKNGLCRAVDICHYHIDHIGGVLFWSTILNNVLEDMRVIRNRYYYKVKTGGS